MKKEDGSLVCEICGLGIHEVNLVTQEHHFHNLCLDNQEEKAKEVIDKTNNMLLAQQKVLLKKAIKTFIIHTLGVLAIGVAIGKFLL